MTSYGVEAREFINVVIGCAWNVRRQKGQVALIATARCGNKA